MPELGEVEYFKRIWSIAEGQCVKNVVFSNKRIFRKTDLEALDSISGSIFIKSLRRGKQLCFLFSNNKWLGIHLGMTGKLMYEKEKAKYKYSHLELLLYNNHKLIFQDPRLFGLVLFHQGKNSPAWWSHLKPEIISNQYTFEVMNDFLNRRKRALSKAFY